MRGKIIEYSGRTGKGILKDSKGKLRSFDYKQLYKRTSLPVGTIVSFTDGVIRPLKSGGKFMYFMTKERKLWQ